VSEKTPSLPWNKILAPYKKADNRLAIWQLVNTAVPFSVLWYLMLVSLEVSYALTLLLALPTAGLSIRLFIFQHDCGHGSFFTSQRANHALGSVLGVLTLTPYRYWRRTHAIHHATSGNLDRREFGDIRTLTVREYLSRPFWQRYGYRLYRNPVVLLLVGPAYQFLFKHRLPFDAPREWKKEWGSVIWNNLALAAVALVMWQTIGLGRFLAVQLTISLLSGAIGVWLFYVQHQFEDTYWEGRERWDFNTAGLEGSSFYDLPALVHWFTGNIGYHHVHHLSSLIPNYRLRQAMEEVPELQHVTRITFFESLRCINLKLWDEDERKLVGFGHLRTIQA
jgi:omega-6 fatty acid desaturase (delta-12 desaturase)